MRNVAVIGSGGREHALCRKLSESKSVGTVYAIPGNIGMCDVAKVLSDVKETDFEAIANVCNENNIEWVVIGPEAPLSEGLADYLIDEHNIKVFGPRKKEAQMESSKAFTKDLMKKYNIPTAKYETFTSYSEAKAYIKKTGAPIVIKKDGLAAGKGVVVAKNEDEALEGLNEMMGEKSTSPVVIEEYLDGEEFSLMILVNGDYYHPFEMLAQDHKRAYDYDKGPNTGGMGAYAPVSHIDENVRHEALKTIVAPTINAMISEGLDYFGTLYLGAIATDDGVKVIEYNARFGDPEAQILLSMLESDFLDVLDQVYNKVPMHLQWKDGATVGITMASSGYPGAYKKGAKVDISEVEKVCFVSGLIEKNGETLTSGGRVVLVTAHANTIEEAIKNAYENVNLVNFEKGSLFYRKDIAHRAL